MHHWLMNKVGRTMPQPNHAQWTICCIIMNFKNNYYIIFSDAYESIRATNNQIIDINKWMMSFIREEIIKIHELEETHAANCTVSTLRLNTNSGRQSGTLRKWCSPPICAFNAGTTKRRLGLSQLGADQLNFRQIRVWMDSKRNQMH